VSVLFSSVAILDDGRIFEPNGRLARCIVAPLLSNPERYARAVNSLVVRDPDVARGFGHQTAGCLFGGEMDGQYALDSPKYIRPMDAEELSSILEVCHNLEEFAWESSIPPPDGLCEVCGYYS
jgi:hypothetical protein